MREKRTYIDFFNDFDSLMKIHRENLPKSYTILPTIKMGVEFAPEDAEEIVNGIKTADALQLRRISLLKYYLVRVLEQFLLKTSDKRNWEYYYGYPESDDDEFFVDVYSIEMGMIPVLRKLLDDLDRPISTFFGIIRPTDTMAVQSISRQKGVPVDIAEHVISPYIGKKAVGGMRTRCSNPHKKKRTVKRKKINQKKIKGI